MWCALSSLGLSSVGHGYAGVSPAEHLGVFKGLEHTLCEERVRELMLRELFEGTSSCHPQIPVERLWRRGQACERSAQG